MNLKKSVEEYKRKLIPFADLDFDDFAHAIVDAHWQAIGLERKSMLDDCAYQGATKKWIRETSSYYKGFNQAINEINKRHKEFVGKSHECDGGDDTGLVDCFQCEKEMINNLTQKE